MVMILSVFVLKTVSDDSTLKDIEILRAALHPVGIIFLLLNNYGAKC